MRHGLGGLRRPAVPGLGLLLLFATSAYAIQAGPVQHQYPLPPGSGAVALTGSYPDLWFTEPDRDALGRLALDGSVTEYFLPVVGSRPLALARVSDSIVFTEPGTNRIGVRSASGELTEYDIPTPASDPRGIAAPSVVYFTEYAGNRIGYLQAGPSPVREIVVPTPNSGPLGIAMGPGANANTYDMWFTEFLANKIGRIDQDGHIREYPIPTPDSGPTSLVGTVVNDEQVVFFTEANANKIGKITESGVITEYVVPTPGSRPTQIFEGLDGAWSLWFSEEAGGKLGRLTADGQIREFPLPPGSQPWGIAATFYRPDGEFTLESIWYLDGANNSLGRLSDNRLYAVGAGHAADFDTEFELASVDGRPTMGRVGLSPPTACPGFCIDPGVELELAAGVPVDAFASEVPFTQGAEQCFR